MRVRDQNSRTGKYTKTNSPQRENPSGLYVQYGLLQRFVLVQFTSLVLTLKLVTPFIKGSGLMISAVQYVIVPVIKQNCLLLPPLLPPQPSPPQSSARHTSKKSSFAPKIITSTHSEQTQGVTTIKSFYTETLNTAQ